MAKPTQPAVHIHSRPMRSDRAPSPIWPGMPTTLTMPSAQAATIGEKPTSIRYFVWCTWTAYQANSAQKKPSTIHQKRVVLSARDIVHSTDAHARSTTFD